VPAKPWTGGIAVLRVSIEEDDKLDGFKGKAGCEEDAAEVAGVAGGPRLARVDLVFVSNRRGSRAGTLTAAKIRRTSATTRPSTGAEMATTLFQPRSRSGLMFSSRGM